MDSFSVWITCNTKEEGESIVSIIAKHFTTQALGNCLNSVEANKRGCRISIEIKGYYNDECGGSTSLRKEIIKHIKDKDWIFIVVNAAASGGSSWSINYEEPKQNPRNNLEEEIPKSQNPRSNLEEEIPKPKEQESPPKEPEPPKLNLKQELFKDRLPLNIFISIIKSTIKLSDTFFDVKKIDRQRLLDKLEEIEEEDLLGMR